MVYKYVLIISNNSDKKPDQITSTVTAIANQMRPITTRTSNIIRKAQPAAGTVSPVAAMAPSGQRAQKHEDNDNQQD
jgi:hypothetical protein